MPSRPRRNLSLDSADARRVRRRRRTESEDETNVRLQSQRQAQQQRRQAQQQRRVATVQQNIMRSDWCSLKDTAFNYDPVIEYSKHPMVDIGSMNKECFHCSALKWKSETLGMCCSNGKINLQPIAEPPEPLKTLLNGETDNSKHFLKNIRKYNSCFQMTSFGADNEVHHGGFQPTFIVQGQIYHTIGSLLPMPGEQHKFLQIYFMGDQDNQANQRTNNITGVRHEIVVDIQRMLLNHNLLINQFKTALQNMPSENFNVVIHADRTPVGRHPGTFNAPTSNDVAVVIAGNVYGTRDIVLKKHDDSLMRVPDTHRFYDALQYPLIFWQGQEGYYFNIPQVNPQTKQPLPNKKVSSMDFYAFHLMFRRDHHVILTFCQLLHQFAVDMYVKVESERLRYITLHQSNLRAESYIHLQDALASDSNIAANDLGQMVILPSSFVNSPRYLAEYTQDAFTYVRKYGRPDLFITFTCNPTWPEIIRELLPGQKHTDRHDLTARVFKQKLNKLIHVIIKGNTFGETAAYMYSVEWQKRGLPHCHILIWLKNKIHPSQIDNVICAELPDPSIDPELSAVVSKNMIHGPCGALNQGSPCMKDGVCSKKFPRQLINETKTNENGYPLYRRRAPANNGLTTTIRMKNSVEVTIDNSWVVPYSPLLCKMFGAHINVESCSSVKAIKYICKYINKGNDAAIFNLQGDNVQRSRDEVKNFQTGRYVSSNEAFWRLFHFSLHERDPPVIHLAVHLESGERIYFTEQVNLQELVRNPPKTTLTGFFQLCTFDNFAKTLTYNELPKYYTWDKSRKNWNRRRQGMPVAGWPGVKEANVLGRIYTVSAVQFECFCVRLLLHHVRGPTSFQSLKTVNGTVYNSYREACETLGLLENDNHWCVTMEEAILCRSAVKLRQLFAILISTCGVSNPRSLWNSYKHHLSEDILNRLQNQNNGDSESIAYNEALILIENSVLSMCGKHLGDFDMERPQQIPNANILLQRELSYNHITLNQLVCSAVPTLIPEQKTIFDYVIEKVNKCEESVIFVDAPGGTGKTHLLNLLLAEVRRHGQIAVAIASSGIAATLLAGGRTAHSVLKLPLDLSKEEKPTCNIAKSSQRGEIFRQCKLLVWDEATMTNKKAFEALDLMLQDIRSCKTKAMGGLVVILAGDFRQTLPVIPRGTPADEIDACLKSSPLWQKVKKFKLTKNMRVHLNNDQTAGEFADELLKIGDGRLPTDIESKVELKVCVVINDKDQLIQAVFPNVSEMYINDNWLGSRAILAPKNECVDQTNSRILDLIPGDVKVFKSIDSVVEERDTVNFPVEFLNSLNVSGTPPHILKLKVGVPVILMRNIDPPKLCNGTRLRIIELGTNIVKATIITGSFSGEQVLIPRIPIIPNNFPFQFKRLQYPIKLAFAMTINKAQGQTLKVAGVNLENPCFSHGQLYVACSRVSEKNNLFVLADEGKTQNIVYQQALI